MSRAVQEGCIASCVRCSLLPDRTHKSYLLRSKRLCRKTVLRHRYDIKLPQHGHVVKQ